MIRFNKSALRDKIYACWLGKNIGGTMGAPFEGTTELLDIQGFNSPEGTALPNDDLDLQLVWLRAMYEQGPKAINSKVLGEYWTNFIGPHLNEYGNCKANMRAGILPPLSGSLHNGDWKHSNGAWIRTEIWACTYPGLPEKAIRYAFEDASVDHGFGEGSYAAIFVAAMESAAFIINDLRTLIRIGLSKIPADCRVARSVGIVLDAYDKGIDWKTARNLVVEDSADLGWFQAPGNVAFAVLGLLYGEGDFKKTMILTVNCGDDTDCTGATVGSLMGIMYGTKIIPEDWKNFIGDNIVTVALVRGTGFFPESCQQLTDLVMNLIPVAACYENFFVEGDSWWTGKETRIELTDGEDDFSEVNAEKFCGDRFVKKMFSRSPYSFTVEGTFASALVEFEKEPVIDANGTLNCKISLSHETVANFHFLNKQDIFELHWHLPEGWTVNGRRTIFLSGGKRLGSEPNFAEITLCAGEKVEPINRLVLEIRRSQHAMPLLVPITILG